MIDFTPRDGVHRVYQTLAPEMDYLLLFNPTPATRIKEMTDQVIGKEIEKLIQTAKENDILDETRQAYSDLHEQWEYPKRKAKSVIRYDQLIKKLTAKLVASYNKNHDYKITINALIAEALYLYVEKHVLDLDDDDFQAVMQDLKRQRLASAIATQIVTLARASINPKHCGIERATLTSHGTIYTLPPRVENGKRAEYDGVDLEFFKAVGIDKKEAKQLKKK